MNTFKCKKCQAEISIEHRDHVCPATRSVNGQMTSTLTIYRPTQAKANKQSTVAGYMKSFGSRAVQS